MSCRSLAGMDGCVVPDPLSRPKIRCPGWYSGSPIIARKSLVRIRESVIQVEPKIRNFDLARSLSIPYSYLIRSGAANSYQVIWSQSLPNANRILENQMKKISLVFVHFMISLHKPYFHIPKEWIFLLLLHPLHSCLTSYFASI